jgi:hypothetical protein
MGGRTVKFIKPSEFGNWLVFEEDKQTGIVHFCKGNPNESPDALNKIRLPGQYNTVGWGEWKKNQEVKPYCEACKEEIPKAILMMMTITNIKI